MPDYRNSTKFDKPSGFKSNVKFENPPLFESGITLSALSDYKPELKFTADMSVLYKYLPSIKFIRPSEHLDQIQESTELVPIKEAEDQQTIAYPVDYMNSYIFNESIAKDLSYIELDMGDRDHKGEAILKIRIDFDAIDDSIGEKKLTVFDKLCLVAVSAIYYAGHTKMTASQIYNVWNPGVRPSQNDIAQINASIHKMAFTEIHIDSSRVHRTIKKYPHIIKHRHLLPIERDTLEEEDLVKDMAINLLAAPPTIYFASTCGHMARLPEKILQAPIRKTQRNLAIMDYLTVRMARAKNDKTKSNPKIRYDTTFQYCGIYEKKAQARAKNTIRRFLDYAIEINYIESYVAEENGVKVSFPQK